MATVVAAASPGTPGHAHGLAANGAVVFTRSAFGIYVTNDAGSALARLTAGRSDEEPMWSPDAERIVFSRGDRVMVMSANGKTLRQVGSGFMPEPKWSPDGSKIAFAGRGITIVGADGTDRKQVVARAELGFAWSPDATRIAFGSDNSVRVVNVATGATRTLAEVTDIAWRLAWSPDGSAIAFYSGETLRLVDPQTGKVRALGRGADTFTPSWSPDGKRLAFVRNNALMTIGRDGRGLRRLADTSFDGLDDGVAASWSGDGALLLYEKQRFPGSETTDIWRVKADGSDARRLTHAFPTGTDAAGPDWAATTVRAERQTTWPMATLPPSRLLRAPLTAVELAADSGAAALMTYDGEDDENRLGIWRPGKSLTTVARGELGSDLVLSGGRATWIEEGAGNTFAFMAIATAQPGSRERTVMNVDPRSGQYLGALAGDGKLLVFNGWRKRNGAVTDAKLWRVVGDRVPSKQLLLAGRDAFRVVAVDAGRIAVLRPDGTFVLLNEHGRRLSEFHLGAKGVGEVRLTKGQLVVQRGATIEVRSATSGAVKHRWPVGGTIARGTLEDASGNFAVYSEGIAIHLLRLSDGRERVLRIPNQAEPADAELEPEGLYYSYNEAGSARPARVGFVTAGRLVARFR